MKRAADSDGGSDAKKAASGSGGGLKGMPGNSDSVSDPIPRPLKLQEITLHFTQRTWEEIGAGELKYLPLCQTPYYMFDEAMKNQLAKFKNIWGTAFYHTPKARITNLLMLQDDLINQGGTPLETTAFTQACYMVTYQPTRQTQYFQLANILDCNTGKFKRLSYDMSDTKCGFDYSQLINISNYEDLEKLAILPAGVDKYAGYNPEAEIYENSNISAEMAATFINPNTKNLNLAEFSANMQPLFPTVLNSAKIVEPLKHVTWSRNLDKIGFHKYGDTIDIPITTNLEGVPLINHPHNDFTLRKETFNVTNESGEITRIYNMYTDFIWPSNNRPYYSRKDNLSAINVFESAKQMKPLQHTFLSMPPIRKANGALLKQRCSFVLEQSFSVTFNTVESIWDDDTDKYTLNQRDGVIVRPVLYTKMLSQTKDEGALCKVGKFVCTGDKCPYDNSFASLIEVLADNEPTSGVISFAASFKPSGTFKYELPEPGTFDNNVFFSDGFKAKWKSWIDYIEPGLLQNFEVNCGQRAFIDLTSRNGKHLRMDAPGMTDFIIRFDIDKYIELMRSIGVTCDYPNLVYAPTEFNSTDRVTEMFYM